MINALTVDVEDYFHVSAFAQTLSTGQWEQLPSRLEHNTGTLLDLFAARGVHATFFVLGWVAERFPAVVKAIAAAGHEIASHGYSHQLVYLQQPQLFADEPQRSKKLLEDLSGCPVKGYRAASYSITDRSLWALDALVELGFEYDSSIFPVYHDRYGIPGAPAGIHVARAPNGGSIVEFPLTTARLFRWRLPVAGGGYFRLYPYWLSRLLLGRSVKDTDHPFIFYLHPWEVDPGQPRIADAPLLSKFRHYLNLHRCQGRLEHLIRDFSFGRTSDVIAAYQARGPLPVYDYGWR